jgi:hypothetical protein
VTKKDIFIAPDGYDANGDDDLHKCDDAKAVIGGITVTGNKTINIPVTQGTHALQSIEVKVDGVVVNTAAITASGTYQVTYDFAKSATITVTIQDIALYAVAATGTYTK